MDTRCNGTLDTSMYIPFAAEIFHFGKNPVPDVDNRWHHDENHYPTAWHDQCHKQTKVMDSRYLQTPSNIMDVFLNIRKFVSLS